MILCEITDNFLIYKDFFLQGRKKKFHRQNILIADEVVAERKEDDVSTKLSLPSTPVHLEESTTPGEKDITLSEEDGATASNNDSMTVKSVAVLEQELSDLENEYEEYNEYNLPDDEKVMGGKAATATPANKKKLATPKSVKVKKVTRVTRAKSDKASVTKAGTMRPENKKSTIASKKKRLSNERRLKNEKKGTPKTPEHKGTSKF